ncbi:MAG: hypothetical protein UT51_C0013G0008 [Candidatus Nomurabacteria bacterium GW2011_GWC2_39_41]|uniref:Uncharacterized protein n=2 Tax=Parcubacteria group TaxID=1794811 RepID=A0A0G1PQF6_9BACT|nr:MAG: hypothetical protein UT51_C0013G0008 [Candidatus Nomurabacteria bacterium GW2011_GWC2_39_41]KKU35031.1 MAG: hypothetical protein UX48_C0020G0001 [Candidatus Azambacteria bacterium GW2011_GWB1_46_27]
MKKDFDKPETKEEKEKRDKEYKEEVKRVAKEKPRLKKFHIQFYA